MAHLHIHLDARAGGNDGLEQIRSAHAFARGCRVYAVPSGSFNSALLVLV